MDLAPSRATETHAPASAPRVAGWEVLSVLALLALLLAVFLEKPLRHLGTHHYTSADVTQDYSLTRVEPRHVPHNQLLSDPAVEMLPWLLHNRGELAEGRIPLWNEWNGCGVPHLANMQSAVFSPFSVPFYVLPLKLALLVAAAAKLLFAGLFTWLFLRRIGLSAGPAFFGAVAFAWCGHNVLLLAYPHASVVALLPAGLWCTEVAIAKLFAREPGAAGALAGLVLSLAAGILAGQPEPFYFVALAIGAWSAFRLFVEGLARRRTPGGTRRTLATSAVLAVAALLAAGVAAVQLLPFFEYLGRSQALTVRDAPQAPLMGVVWPFLFFPNLLGNPAKLGEGWPNGPQPNFELVNSITTSAIVVFLGLVSVAFVRQSRAHAFFAVVLAVWVAYAYDALGFGRAIGKLVPGLALAPMNRSHPIGVLALCVSAAFAVERLGALRGRARIAWSAALVVLAAAGAWLAMREAHVRLDRYFARNAVPPEFVEFARGHVTAMVALFASGTALVVLIAWLRDGFLRKGAHALLAAVAFVPWGWMLRNYNPTVPDETVLPRTAAIERLATLVRDERLLVLGPDTLPPDTNMAYGIRLPTSYDALGIADYDELYRAHFGEGGNWRTARSATFAGLSMLGIRHVLTRGAWIPVETTFGGLAWSDRQRFRAGPIVPGLEIVQTFTAGADDLMAIRIELATDARANRCTLWLSLEDVESGAVLDVQSLDASGLRSDEHERCELVYRFEPVPQSRGRRYRLSLSSPDATPSQCVLALASHEFGQAEQYALVKRERAPLAEIVPGELTVGGVAKQGGLVLDLAYARDRFRRIAEIAGFTLWKYEAGNEPFAFVEEGVFVRDAQESLARTLADDFDPARQVVLLATEDAEGPRPPRSAGGAEATEVHVERVDATTVRVRVRASSAGWLVAALPAYPGWRARVNGAERPLLRANHAFSAVTVAAGSSEVELAYAPASFRHGAWISLASLLLGVLAVLWVRRGA